MAAQRPSTSSRSSRPSSTIATMWSPTHPLRAPQGRGESPHPRRSHHSLAKHRRGDRHNQGQRQSGSRPRCPLRALRPLRASDCRHRGHAPLVSSPAWSRTSSTTTTTRSWPRSSASSSSFKKTTPVCRNLIKEGAHRDTRQVWRRPPHRHRLYLAGDFNAEDFYADDDMIITISHLGYIKAHSPLRVPSPEPRRSREPKAATPRQRLHRAYLHRLDALLHALLHQPRTVLLA